MLATGDNPEGLPLSVFDGIRAGEKANRSQLYRDLAYGPFFGHNRRGDVSQGFRDAFWLQAMACGHRAAHECIAAFSATDFRADLATIDVPTLVIHGDDDQFVPFEVGGKRTAELINGAQLKVYPGGPHGITRHTRSSSPATCSPSSTADLQPRRATHADRPDTSSSSTASG